MNIEVIGGGPAGLFFSLLMKQRHPSDRIVVHERNAAGATYGWGVVFSDVALAFLKEADERFYRKFTAHHERCDYMEVVHQGVSVRLNNNHFSRTSRIDLLRVLQDACAQAGVEVRYNSRISDPSQLPEADVIVAADGVNSEVRTHLAGHFQPSFDVRRNKFAWYGTSHLFHPVSLIFRQTEFGVFIAHAYQYSKTHSTFLVEVDPETWKRAGLEHATQDASRVFCERVFAQDLGGSPLLSNRSQWFQASVVRNANWTHGNVVLLGDALRSVHFSLGSGTRMAMQDAIALFEALCARRDDVPAAFAAFEESRRGASDRFQDAAQRSLDWYESVGTRMHLDPASFAYDYMRRTGRVSHEELRRRDPAFIEQVEAVALDQRMHGQAA
ncbi:FAD-dependent monooxygenase [Cupriavidus sp. CV2]|uniref:FAD-dependent monooxygenase n=1 Tax=Cupriavidus ulmosensis TaxID=3065913 RepID=UPI00296B193C|nr:FAD-dependent monooxygenase [Cupriavidus sp. CV2]MDW3682132.1 FAD-dependent monooxygenase [Cupriavidus sp. CV2]